MTGEKPGPGPRIKSLARGLVYGFLAVTAFALLFGPDASQATQQKTLTAQVMAAPGWALGRRAGRRVRRGRRLTLVVEGLRLTFMRYFPAGSLSPGCARRSDSSVASAPWLVVWCSRWPARWSSRPPGPTSRPRRRPGRRAEDAARPSLRPAAAGAGRRRPDGLRGLRPRRGEVPACLRLRSSLSRVRRSPAPDPVALRRLAGGRAPGAGTRSQVAWRLGLGAVAVTAFLVLSGCCSRISPTPARCCPATWRSTGGSPRGGPGRRHADGFGSGSANTQTAIAVAAVAFLLLRWWLGRWYESWVVVAAIVGELVVFLAVTAAVHRARPAVQRLDVAPPTSSFPSGHTGAAVALYGCLAYLVLRYARRRVLRRRAGDAPVPGPGRRRRVAAVPRDALPHRRRWRARSAAGCGCSSCCSR